MNNLLPLKVESFSTLGRALLILCFVLVANSSFAATKTIDCFAGTDTLNISYNSYDLGDFSTSYNSTSNTITFTDPSSNTIAASNCEYFNFNSVTYRFIYNGYDYVSQQQVNNGTSCDIGNGENNRISHAFISNDGTKVYLFTPSDSSCTNYTIPSSVSFGTPPSSYYSSNLSVTITGSDIADMVSDRGSLGGSAGSDFTINTGAGDDQVRITSNIGGDVNGVAFTNEDTIDLGSGDDIVYVGSDYQTDNFDGGVGSDWFAFSFGGPSTITMTINTHDSSNFENIAGSTGNDVFTGDGSANILLGGKGNDTLTGGAGDDTLYGGIGQNCSGTNLVNDKNFTVGIYYNHYYQGAGNDTLYGQAGNDTLYGQCQDDTLDGGTGADILHGGDGTDTFVIRSGDGGEAITDADTIQDFTDGTDVLGLASLNYSDLTIEQGTGSYSSHVVVKKTSSGEFLAVVQNTSVSDFTIIDFTSPSTSSQTISGTSGNDQSIGGSGNDTFNGGAGSDTLYGWGGDDTFNVTNKSGTYTDTLNGGSGKDTLNVSYSSYDVTNFGITYNSSTNTITFTDPNGGVINASNFEYFNFNSVTYRFIYNGYDYVSQQQVNNGTSCDIGNGENNRISHAFISNDGTKVYLFTPSDSSCTNYTIPSSVSFGTPPSSYYSSNLSVTITGSDIADMVSDRGSLGGSAGSDFTINTGAGDDQVRITSNIGGDVNGVAFTNEDTIDLGSGDDIVYVGSDYQTDNFDGGVGSDWFAFSFGGPSTITMTINTHDSSNFENIAGSTGNDVFTGDGSANILLGGKGNDTLTGGAGDDTLYGGIGQNCSGTNLVNDKNFTVGIYYNHYYQGAGNDTLYGQAGNDTLYGQCQDDTLDGGTGADILHGGDGTDTFVIRSGDGGEAITDADTIQDFTDGTDVLGLASLNYSDLTIEQGTGSYSSHVVVKKTSSGEFLAVVQNTSVSDFTIIDFTSPSTSSQTISGTSGNDQSIGGSGNDTFNGGAGSDTLYGWGGDDTFNVTNKSGTYTDTLNGGSGKDTLNVSYSSYDVTNFGITYNSSTNTITFTDPNGGVINASNFEYFNFNSVTYRFIYNGYDYVSQQQVNNGTSCDIGNGENNRISHAFISNDGTKVYLFTPSDSSCTNYTIPSSVSFGTPPSSYYSSNLSVTITGSDIADMVSDRGSLGGSAGSDFTINTGAGDDQVRITSNIGGDVNGVAFTNEDTIDLGSGDDIVYVGSDYQTDNFDGGVGSDWFAFSFGGPSTITMTINTHDSSNFENIAGSTGNDVFTGDGSANILLGGKGNDTLTGGAGDDTLYGGIGQNCSGTNLVNDKNFTVGIYYNHYYQGAGNDTLYGQAGNDTLYGQCQDDTLDGGTGADILHGGDGTDTFVIRSGDGGEAITDADTVTDFTDKTDIIGMSGLNYSDLTIEQGTGSYSSHVVVKKTSSGEFLTIIQNISLSSVDDNDFSAI